MKQSISHKFFLIIAVILLFNILVTLLFGNTLMEKFYIEDKKQELRQSYNTLVTIIVDNTIDVSSDPMLADAIFNLEKSNITILIFEHSDQNDIQYYTRGNRPPEWGGNPQEKIPQQRSFNPITYYSPDSWISKAAEYDVFSSTSLPLLVNENTEQRPNFKTLSLYGQLENGQYVFLSTPQEPLALAAKLGVQYNLYISLATFLLATVLIYFVSKRFSKPIQDIDQAARRISQMDFSQQCDVRTNDELEALSNSINSMADKLKAYIEQLKLNQELLQKDLDREAKTNQLRKEFITNVSHDFKTPLTLIRAYTESLTEQTLPAEDQAAYYQIILKETERMTALVTRLLQLSKLESGVITLEESLFPLDEMMRDILHNNQILIKEKQLHIRLLPEEDCFAYGDYNRIEQVLVNLIENAIKYSPDQGTITLDIQPTDHQTYYVSITNTSPPLPENQLEDIFISFYKRDQSRKSENNSFGLGLAIVKAVMDLHQQPCGALNTPDGLQFWFELPSVTDI